MAQISLSNLAAQVTRFPAAQEPATEQAVEPKPVPFTKHPMESYQQAYDMLQFKLADARSNVQNLETHIRALNQKLQQARELEELACENEESREAKSDLLRARALIESVSKRVADLEARLVGWRRTLHSLELQLKEFPQAQLHKERKLAQLRSQVPKVDGPGPGIGEKLI